jgi:hypothetical protein
MTNDYVNGHYTALPEAAIADRFQRDLRMTLRASAVILVAALVAGPAGAADIGYLAPPGVPAAEFPALQRPVAPIVSPTREVRRP